MFSLKNIIGLVVMFRLIIHLKLIFVASVRFSFFLYGYPVVPTPFVVKKTSFPIELLWHVS